MTVDKLQMFKVEESKVKVAACLNVSAVRTL